MGKGGRKSDCSIGEHCRILNYLKAFSDETGDSNERR